MKGSYYLLDTFTHEKFKGNPTPVFLLDEALSEPEMKALARECNAPVTAFIEPLHNAVIPVRYFTVNGEIPACGHATLGAAWVLMKTLPTAPVHFETIEKTRLIASRDGADIFIQYPRFEDTPITSPTCVKAALGLAAVRAECFSAALQILFIELESEAEVKAITPDFKRLRESSDSIKEVVVMAGSETPGYDYILRSFCPWIGIDEDPVTGSIHSVLGPYWQRRLGRDRLNAWQASERGGQVSVRVYQDHVAIGGGVRLIIEGSLM